MRRRRIVDVLARCVVTGGGVTSIVVILLILLFIGYEAWPLLSDARVESKPAVRVDGLSPAVVDVEKQRNVFVSMGLDGSVQVSRPRDPARNRRLDATTGEPLLDGAAASTRFVRVQKTPGQLIFSGVSEAGDLIVFPYRWASEFGSSEVELRGAPVRLRWPGKTTAPSVWSVQINRAGRATAIAQWGSGPLRLVHSRLVTDDDSGEVERKTQYAQIETSQALQYLLLAKDSNWIYGIERGDQVLHTWPLRGGLRVGEATSVPVTGAPITAVSFLKGDISLLLGRRDGSIEVWFRIKEVLGAKGAERVEQRPQLIRSFELPQESIRALVPSPRTKGFLALGEEGGVGLYYSTSHRTLWTGKSPLGATAVAMAYAPREDAAVLVGAGAIAELSIHNPHPSASFSAFFLPVHYERAEEPAVAWQSSSSSDDYEPKISLLPLIFGTLKGTFFSLLLAVPLAVLGALFTSQFLHPKSKAVIKPVIEIMAALPSVVLGFIGGLWLAPHIETILPGMLLMLVVLPLVTVVAGALWHRLKPEWRAKWPHNTELVFYMLALCFGGWLCSLLSGGVETMIFAGDYRAWFQSTLGLEYDQRNALVVALAMGFAVIPIIYTISEDAFSNVPRSLALGSRALGATQWQSVTRVILPTASPGIFSAIMVGFGRAVGETMIVLMATGNTPITDWSPFNGFRTLSANIATELPEAPHEGTLYRTLFLSAFLLFLLTFLVNTAAELVRERLRKKYGRI